MPSQVVAVWVGFAVDSVLVPIIVVLAALGELLVLTVAAPPDEEDGDEDEDVSVCAISLLELLLASEPPMPPPTAAPATNKNTASISIIKARFEKPQYLRVLGDCPACGRSTACCEK